MFMEVKIYVFTPLLIYGGKNTRLYSAKNSTEDQDYFNKSKGGIHNGVSVRAERISYL